MNLFALAVIFVVLQAAPPVPRQTPDKSSANGQPVKKNAATNQNPSASVLLPENAIEPQTQQGQPEKPHDPHEQITVVVQQPPSGWEKAYVVLTGLLAIIGMFGVAAAFRTLKAVEAQAGIMRGQLEAMKGQIAQMEDSGAQTAELIKHAAGQVTALTDSAQAAKEMAEAARVTAMAAENGALAATDSARAARVSADALISAERPWLNISVEQIQGASSAFLHQFSVKNLGRTPAMVVGASTMCVVCESLPGEPDYLEKVEDATKRREESGEAMILAPNEIWKFKVVDMSGIEPGWLMNQLAFDEVKSGKRKFFYYGKVRYRDVFAPAMLHETHFCYIYKLGDFLPFSSPEYNRYT